MELDTDIWHKHTGTVADFKSLLIDRSELWTNLELLHDEVRDLIIGQYNIHIIQIIIVWLLLLVLQVMLFQLFDFTSNFSLGSLTLLSYRAVIRAKYISECK